MTDDHTPEPRTVTVTLTEEQAAFIDAAVARGEYTDAAEAVADGVEHLRDTQWTLPEEGPERAAWDTVLKDAAERGLADIEAGRYATIRSEADLRAFMDEIDREVDARLEARNRQRRRA